MMIRVFYAFVVALAIGAFCCAAPTLAADNLIPKSIGMATMLPDRTIVLNLSHDDNGVHFDDELRYRPSDADYDAVLAHLGGMSPGDWKSVVPF